jgi:predicted transcriptional regulator
MLTAEYCTCNIMYPRNMACFRYIIVNTLHKVIIIIIINIDLIKRKMQRNIKQVSRF